MERLVRRLKAEQPEAADVMEHPPGQEAQSLFIDAVGGMPQITRPQVYRVVRAVLPRKRF